MRAALPSLMLVRRSLFGFWAALVLATVSFQAAVPLPAPLEPAHGSAFSATTVEVALATRRPAEAARAVVAPQPLVPLPVDAAPRLAAPALAVIPAPRPDSTGPPAQDILVLQPAPRAPPAS